MNKKNIMSRFAVVLTVVFALGACTGEFDNYNSTGAPTEKQAEGDFFYLGTNFMSLQTNIVVVSTTNGYQYNENLAAQPYARYLSGTKDVWATTYFSVFNAPRDWLNALFNDQMSRVYSAWFHLKESNDKGNIPSFAWAWAEILRVAAVQRTTDMYGPLPYSELKKGEDALYVKYDSQADVYAGMFADLNAAIEDLKNYVASGTSYNALSEYDLIYEGDFSKWLRFANSIKLRMAMRISFVDPENARRYALEAIADGVIESNDQNATILNGNNPLWVMAGAYEDTRAGAEITSFLNGYKDPRMSKYFLTVEKGVNAGKVAGMRSGIAISSHTWACENFSKPATGEQDPVILITAAEMAFAKAEAVAYHGWNLGDGKTAKDHYENGVRLSFDQWGASGVDTYLADDTSKQAAYSDDSGNSASAVSTVTIKWEDSANSELKLERIITQKWLAMFPLGMEGWSENRRTGYPRFFSVANNYSSESNMQNRGASRIPFPASEKENNAENYNAAVTDYLGGFDGYGVRLWWDVKSGKPGF